VEQYRQSGFNGILGKPFAARDVKAAVAFCSALSVSDDVSHATASQQWFSVGAF
jgi:hypothetical protein